MNRIKMINKDNGAEMWVAETRIDEYLALGHILPVIAKAKPVEPIETEKKTAPKTTAKSTKKRGR
jgi:hypothetical protein